MTTKTQLIYKLTQQSLSKKTIITFLTLGLTVFLIVGCGGVTTNGYVEEYVAANKLNPTRSTGVNKNAQEKKELFRNIENLFSDLKQPDLEQKIANTYAENIYFNDTLHTYFHRDEIVSYLLATADRVLGAKTKFEEIAQSERSYFVRWKMDITFLLQGKRIHAESIGVSQIKFDDQGKVIFHQDFWDNTEGFFRHLPIVGYVVGKAKERL